MRRVQGLIAAAGTGSRARVPFPKTLFSVQGKPILIRALEAMECIDPSPTVVVSPSGARDIESCVADHGRTAHFVVQDSARGMGDAVLCLTESAAAPADHVLLMWGDIPFIQDATLKALVCNHLGSGDDFTFVTALVDAAYTVVTRDASGRVLAVEETRESGVVKPLPGERDIGLFIFRRQLVLEMLRKDIPAKIGRRTGEHGFLYVIAALVGNGFRVSALPIASARETLSFNSIDDISRFV